MRLKGFHMMQLHPFLWEAEALLMSVLLASDVDCP